MLTEIEIHFLMDSLDDAYDLSLNYSSPASMLYSANPTKYPFDSYDDALEARELYRKLMQMSSIRSKDSYYNPEVK